MRKLFFSRWLMLLLAAVLLLAAGIAASAQPTETAAPAGASPQQAPVSLQVKTKGHFQFVAYGDIRFTNPTDHKNTNPDARRALVAQIAALDPKFVVVIGDLVLRGSNPADWAVWDQETKPWQEAKLRVFPLIGNHELYSDAGAGLRNYFQRFPELDQSRYYSVRAGNALVLVLDSSQPEITGPQGQWITSQLDHLPEDVDFVFFALHHPPYTNSADHWVGGGHSARGPERALAKFLEGRQPAAHARFVVFSGHVHNYERYEHQGVTYIVSGGGGATPYFVSRGPTDAYRQPGPTYHYCLVSVNGHKAEISMMKLDLQQGHAAFTQADSVTITSTKGKSKSAAQ